MSAPKVVLFSNVWFDNDYYVPAAHAQALTADEAQKKYLDALNHEHLPVPAVPYNPLADTVEIANSRHDHESHQVYQFSPIAAGSLLYHDVQYGPKLGWRITINGEVVYEQPGDQDTQADAA